MTESAAATDTRTAVGAAHDAAHALETLLDSYPASLSAEGATEAAAVLTQMKADLAPTLAQLDELKQALDDNAAQNP